MVAQPPEGQGSRLKRHERHRESHVKANTMDTIPGDVFLQYLVIFFIIFMFKEERHKQGKIKKMKEEEEKWKEYKTALDEIMKLSEKLQKEMDEAKSQFKNGWKNTFLYPDWRKEFFHPVPLTLDPDTAHPKLILSEGRRRVTMGEKAQNLSNNSLRFRSLPCVLAQEEISSGRWYWEVEVGHCTAWDLGICRHVVTRKDRIFVKPGAGFWAIRLYNEEYWAVTSPETLLTLTERPTRVCVFLEYEEGRVSFYNMTDKTHIHTFSQASFDGSLRPFFRLWSSDSGHLTICPAPRAAQASDNPNSVPTSALGAAYTLQISED